MSNHKSEPCTLSTETCVAHTTRILGDKWSPRIIHALSRGPKRFTQLQADAGGVNPRTLSLRLDDLEEAGIITRTLFAEVPPRTEYALTPKGRDLLPILEQMVQWGERYGESEISNQT